MVTKGRNASMEQLRVVAMLLIIGHHFVYYGGLLNAENLFNRCFAQFVNIGGKLGVNLFVLIGGWYMSKKEYRAERTVRLWLQSASTGLFMLILCALIWGGGSIGNGKDAILGALFPVSQNACWFAGTYIILTLLMPFLNLILHSVGRRGMDILLCAAGTAICLIPTVFIGKEMYFSPILWFVYLYLLVGRLRRWTCPALSRHGMKLFFFSVALIWLSTLLWSAIGQGNEAIWLYRNYYAERMETLPMLIASLGLFMAFVQKKPCRNPNVEAAGRACFGIYLIHDNPIFRTHLWNEWIRPWALSDSPVLMIYTALAVGMIFMGGWAVEWIRAHTIGRAEQWLLARFAPQLRRFDRILRHELTGGWKMNT